MRGDGDGRGRGGGKQSSGKGQGKGTHQQRRPQWLDEWKETKEEKEEAAPGWSRKSWASVVTSVVVMSSLEPWLVLLFTPVLYASHLISLRYLRTSRELKGVLKVLGSSRAH